MAKEDNNPQQELNVPSGAKKAEAANEPLLFTMPQKFRHGAAPEVKMSEPKAPAPKPVAPPPPPVAPAPKPVVMPVPAKRSKGTMVLILVGILLVAGIGVGAFFLLRPPAAPTTPVTTPTTPTAPVTPTPSAPTTPTQPTTPTDPTDPFARATTPGTDTDSDGLTDVEELEIYKTNARLPDSDIDGFLDGNEVFHRYNPNGDAPATLLGSGLVSKHEAGTYTILYPTPWGTDVDATTPNDVVFRSTTGEAISVKTERKEPEETIQAWFAAQEIDETVLATQTKNGYSMLVSDDQLMAFVDAGDTVLMLSYDSGAKGTIDYLQSYQMMINSIELIGAL